MLGLGAGIDRRLVYNLDWVLLGTAILLALLGTAMVYSATHAGSQPELYLKQLTLVGVGLVAMAFAATIDYRRLADRAVLLYAASVLALVYVLRFAPVIAGTRRWIVIAGFQLQPSELVKLAAAVFAAKVFSEYRQESLGLRDVALPGAAVGLLALLIAREPDLGSAACLVPLFLAIAFLAGLRMRAVLGLAAVLLLSAGLAWPFLKDYQKTRIYTFLDPSLDPRGSGLPEDPVADRGRLGGPRRPRLRCRAARRSSATCLRVTPTSCSRCWPRSSASSACSSRSHSTCSWSGACWRPRASRATGSAPSWSWA